MGDFFLYVLATLVSSGRQTLLEERNTDSFIMLTSYRYEYRYIFTKSRGSFFSKYVLWRSHHEQFNRNKRNG
jgi:hypothetical protein